MGRWNEIDPFWLSPEEEAAMEQDADQERELTAEEDAAIGRSYQRLKMMLEDQDEAKELIKKCCLALCERWGEDPYDPGSDGVLNWESHEATVIFVLEAARKCC